MLKIDRRSISEMFLGGGSDVYHRAESFLYANGIGKIIEQGVLVGLSGGADSVMLLCFLIEYRRRHNIEFPILAVHVNHGIRGEEADRDECFCRDLCKALCIDFVSVKRDIPSISKECGAGVEETARKIRYSVFKEIISGRNDFACIAVAHNMSDNAETVLFNILRGSGSRGASGIRPVRENIVRPLLDNSKSEIVDALVLGEIPFVTDSTNLDDSYCRNYVRHEIIPTLGKISNNPEKMISRFAMNLRSDDDYILSVAREFIDLHSIITNLDLASLHYSVYARVLSLMSGYDFGYLSSKVTRDVFSLLQKDNFTYSLYENIVFVCERGVCRVEKVGDNTDYTIEISYGTTLLDSLDGAFMLSNVAVDKSSLNVYKKSIQANLSSAIIDGSLYLRPKKDGDTIYYGGITRKVKKLYCDKKIPLSVRKKLPLLCDDKGVVWVPGFGVRDDGAPSEERRDLYAVLALNEDYE